MSKTEFLAWGLAIIAGPIGYGLGHMRGQIVGIDWYKKWIVGYER